MPKSKKHLRRRKRKTSKKRQPQRAPQSWDGRGGYTKTDGESNLCAYDKNHRLIKVLEWSDDKKITGLCSMAGAPPLPDDIKCPTVEEAAENQKRFYEKLGFFSTGASLAQGFLLSGSTTGAAILRNAREYEDGAAVTARFAQMTKGIYSTPFELTDINELLARLDTSKFDSSYEELLYEKEFLPLCENVQCVEGSIEGEDCTTCRGLGISLAQLEELGEDFLQGLDDFEIEPTPPWKLEGSRSEEFPFLTPQEFPKCDCVKPLDLLIFNEQY